MVLRSDPELKEGQEKVSMKVVFLVYEEGFSRGIMRKVELPIGEPLNINKFILQGLESEDFRFNLIAEIKDGVIKDVSYELVGPPGSLHDAHGPMRFIGEGDGRREIVGELGRQLAAYGFGYDLQGTGTEEHPLKLVARPTKAPDATDDLDKTRANISAAVRTKAKNTEPTTGEQPDGYGDIGDPHDTIEPLDTDELFPDYDEKENPKKELENQETSGFFKNFSWKKVLKGGRDRGAAALAWTWKAGGKVLGKLGPASKSALSWTRRNGGWALGKAWSFTKSLGPLALAAGGGLLLAGRKGISWTGDKLLDFVKDEGPGLKDPNAPKFGEETRKKLGRFARRKMAHLKARGKKKVFEETALEDGITNDIEGEVSRSETVHNLVDHMKKNPKDFPEFQFEGEFQEKEAHDFAEWAYDHSNDLRNKDVRRKFNRAILKFGATSLAAASAYYGYRVARKGAKWLTQTALNIPSRLFYGTVNGMSRGWNAVKKPDSYAETWYKRPFKWAAQGAKSTMSAFDAPEGSGRLRRAANGFGKVFVGGPTAIVYGAYQFSVGVLSPLRGVSHYTGKTASALGMGALGLASQAVVAPIVDGVGLRPANLMPPRYAFMKEIPAGKTEADGLVWPKAEYTGILGVTGAFRDAFNAGPLSLLFSQNDQTSSRNASGSPKMLKTLAATMLALKRFNTIDAARLFKDVKALPYKTAQAKVLREAYEDGETWVKKSNNRIKPVGAAGKRKLFWRALDEMPEDKVENLMLSIADFFNIEDVTPLAVFLPNLYVFIRELMSESPEEEAARVA